MIRDAPVAPCCRATPRRQAGTTLVELVISIAVIGIAVAGVLQVMTYTTARSADPMVREQALMIAEAYMEEILLKKFTDPTANSVCPVPIVPRTNFDNVCDYNGLPDNIVRDQFGAAILGLEAYTVTVTVTPNLANPTGAVALDSITNDYGSAPNRIRLLRVDVSVTGPGGTSIPLTGYRTKYDCDITVVGSCPTL